MLIPIFYHGPYIVHRHRDSKGNYDLKAIKSELISTVSRRIAHCSGVYIYLQRTARGKLLARYVGVNTNGHILFEAMSKSHILSKDILDERGSRWLLLLTCHRPKGMRDSSFHRALKKLEKALILDLAIKRHPLANIMLHPKAPHFDFGVNGKSKAVGIFKESVNRKPPHV